MDIEGLSDDDDDADDDDDEDDDEEEKNPSDSGIDADDHDHADTDQFGTSGNVYEEVVSEDEVQDNSEGPAAQVHEVGFPKLTPNSFYHSQC